MNTDLLPMSFFARDALTLAEELLGKRLHHGPVVLSIVETEAYLPNDSACHAYKGKTARNAPMFGPAGHAYVYLCYGIHMLFNIVVDTPGVPAAVLIRGAKVVSGEELVRERRKGRIDLDGPGKVGQALAVNVAHSGIPLNTDIWLSDGPVPGRIVNKPRVGIDYALPKHRDALWRFIATPMETRVV